eukprot:6903836-Prymnesium_polylepis.1
MAGLGLRRGPLHAILFVNYTASTKTDFLGVFALSREDVAGPRCERAHAGGRRPGGRRLSASESGVDTRRSC